MYSFSSKINNKIRVHYNDKIISKGAIPISDNLQSQNREDKKISGIDWNTNIQSGNSGDAVKEIQEKLKQLGYYQGKIDGIFGSLTDTATKDFQLDYKLNSDGIIGPITRGRIAETLSSGTILQYGSVDVEVKTLQRQLKNLQLYAGEIDGIFGPVTDAAVKGFQKNNSLIEDGKVGAKTKQTLKNQLLGEYHDFEAGVNGPMTDLTGTANEPVQTEAAAQIGQATAGQTNETGKAYVTAEQLQKLGWTNIDEAMLKDLNGCLDRYQINNARRIQHFISQCSVESGYGQYKIEQSWNKNKIAGQQYEGRADLGNTQPGDGPKYKGVGYLQLTGRKNYQSFADNVHDPQIVEKGAEYVAQKYPWTCAGFYWDREHFNALCDQGASVEAISKKVNCGSENSSCHPNGLPERKECFSKCTKIFQ